MKSKTISTIVTYNPNTLKLNECLLAITNQVHQILIIDNHSKNIDEIIALIHKKNVFLIRNSENIGLSKSYNKALRYARENNYDFLLLLDQDSTCSGNMIEEFSKHASNDYACLVPFKHHQNEDYQQHLYKTSKDSIPHGDSELVETAINSGTCINLNILPKDFLFNENLFVDCIDWDFFLRLQKASLKVLRVNTTEISVEIGNTKKIHFFKYTWFTKNYSPTRLKICAKDFIIFLKSNYKLGWNKLRNHIIYTLWMYWMIIFEKNRIKKYFAIFTGLIQGLFTKVSP